MEKKHQYVYKNIYSYDIPACHYNILKNNKDYDISHIDPSDKLKRNTEIGMMMRNDPSLTKFLRKTTKEIIDFYIENNFLKKSDILLRQYDGFYSTCSINVDIPNNFPAKLEFKNLYDIFIFSIYSNKMYIGIDCYQDKLLIKGISNRYKEIDKIYKKILNINFLSVKSIVQNFKKIKKYFLNTNNKKLYMIPKNDRYMLYMKDYGEIGFNRKAIDLIELDEIDRYKYFQIYIEPFFKSIIYEIF